MEKLLLLLHLIFILECLSSKWINSTHLSEWLYPWERCVIERKPMDIDSFKQNATICNNGRKPTFHCFVGDNRNAKYCHSGRQISDYVVKSYGEELDDPKHKYLLRIVEILHRKRGSWFFLGDSQMTAFRIGMYCDLFRSVPAMQPMDWLRALYPIKDTAHNHTLSFSIVQDFDTMNLTQYKAHMASVIGLALAEGNEHMLLLLNFGAHYNSFHVKGQHIHQTDYLYRLEQLLPWFNNITDVFPHNTFDILWMDTLPQHFDSENGYFEGKHTKCVPMRNTSRALEWRNLYVQRVIQSHGLSRIRVVDVSHMKELHREHCHGDHVDCTHYIWWPMLYQPIFKQIYDYINY